MPIWRISIIGEKLKGSGRQVWTVFSPQILVIVVVDHEAYDLQD